MKKLLSVLLSFVLIITISQAGIFGITANAATSGRCGDNATWKISNRTLTISGSGRMYSYSSDSKAPWCEYDVKKTYDKVIISSGITSVGAYAFYFCKNIFSISIPDTVSSFGECAFEVCESLRSVNIPYGIRTIPNFCFDDCHSLTAIKIPSSVSSFGQDAFGDCGITEFAVPEGVKKIPYGMFWGCSQLERVYIPSSVNEIGVFAFHNCGNLYSIYYGGSASSFNSIDIDSLSTYNEGILRANIYYNHTHSYGSYLADAGTHWTECYCGCVGNESKHSFVKGKCTVCNNYMWTNFPDVDHTAWYGNAVSYVVSEGIMLGYSTGKFGTSDGIQRQDLIVILARISGVDLSSYANKVNFTDAQRGSYYYNALAWAKATGVSNGYANGKFGVGNKVTREQIMTFLHNYAKLKGYDTSIKSDNYSTMSDYKNVSDYAKTAVAWAISNGVISGKSTAAGVRIAPQANAQRCEIAQIFMNIDNKNIFS